MEGQPGDSDPAQAKKRRRKVWSRSHREEILRSTAGRCYSCGLAMDISDDWWVEHIIPHSLGGSDNTDNLLPSCRLCNFVRSNHSPDYIRRILVIGSALIREVDRGSQLGVSVEAFLQEREQRLAKRRKHSHLAMNAAALNTLRHERQPVQQKPLIADAHLHGNKAPGEPGGAVEGRA
ncbi:HNH endonuclease [Gemmata sp.]|uniref:HNH endonuclease n=1 Tax=Gemmata sp. TaxID=1914242 RepID=UPI003F6E6D9F